MTERKNNTRNWLLAGLFLGLALAWWQLGSRPSSVEDSITEIRPVNSGPEEPSTDNDNPGETVDPSPFAENEGEITALDQYKELTRYPSSTRRLTTDSHDLLNPGARHERRTPLPDEEDPDAQWQVLFTADRYFVRDEEPILISLQLWNGGEPVLPEPVTMHAQALDSTKDTRPISLALQTDGKSRTAVFKPNDHWPDFVGRVRVGSDFGAARMSTRKATLDFYFTGAKKIPARFTGQIADRLFNGDLFFDIGLEVINSGLFRIEGNLFDATGQPFGWARYEGELLKGNAVASLQFYGLLFHDTQASGPYVLRGLRGYRLRPGDVPNREDMQEFAGDYTVTGNYALGSFRADINDSPRRQRMIEMYEDAERRGVKLTKPAYTGDGN